MYGNTIFTLKFYQELKNKKWRYQITKHLCKKKSLKKIECLSYCADLNVEEKH